MKALILVFLLAGCGGNWTRMDCSKTIKTATITWEQTDDPAATCEKLGAKTLDRGGACVSVDGDKSTLHAEAPAKIDEQFLGHEVKHAFGCKHK